MDLVVDCDDKQSAIANSGGAPHGAGQGLPPYHFARTGIHGHHLGKAGGDIKVPVFIGDTASRAAPHIVGGNVGVPDGSPGLGIDGGDAVFRILGEQTAIGDHRLGQQFHAVGGAIPHIFPPCLGNILSHFHMVHGVVGITASLRPLIVWFGGRQQDVCLAILELGLKVFFL